MDAGSKQLHAFTYPSQIGGEGPDKVISLFDFSLHLNNTQATKFGHLVLWADSCPAHFKENDILFFCDNLVQTQRSVPVDLKFLLEGHTYSISDRRFGSIENAWKNFETLESPFDWIAKVNETSVQNLVIHEVTFNMIKSYTWKTFLRNAYVSRNKDVNGTTFPVRKLAWLNFGIGESKDPWLQ